MAETDIAGATISDVSGQTTEYSVDQAHLDNADGGDEVRWSIPNWSKNYGYWKNVPEVNSVINTVARFTVGKGLEADPITIQLLDTIIGIGNESFNTIIENAVRTYYIAGDSFTEIIRDKEGNLTNLKSLDPSTINVIFNKSGMITGYEQTTKGKPIPLKTDQILHLTRNRIGNNMGGESFITPLEKNILEIVEAEDDYKTMLHRNVHPRWIIKLDTDIESEITAFKTKYDQANATGENMYIPMGTVEVEQVSVAGNATLNPLPWIESRRKKFYQAAGVPEIVVGGSGEFTDGAGKMGYLSFQQTIEEEQLYIEEQLLRQLNIVVDFLFPASIQNDLISDNAKDAEKETRMQPNETTAGEGQ